MEMFVTFEGIDGCGKSTQARLFFESVLNSGFQAILTREPGGETEVGESVRNILLHKQTDIDKVTEFLLFAADRNEHFERVILPELRSGRMVICDRFIDSSVAYQGYGRGVDIRFIEAVHDFITDKLRPDVTFIVDVKPETGLMRLNKLDRIEKSGVEFLQKVREGYLELAGKESRFCVVDGELNIDEIRKIIWEEFISRRNRWTKARR